MEEEFLELGSFGREEDVDNDIFGSPSRLKDI